MLKIGLTGGIGSGKSTAATMFVELGATLIDLDKISRDLVKPGMPSLEKISEHFGSDILDSQGGLDRAKLRELIFADKREKDWLENLLHPLIREQQQRLIDSATGPYTLIEIPLLVENQLQHTVDRILVVDVNEQTQLARASERDNRDRSQIAAILASQASREERLKIADDVINNNGAIEELKQRVEDLHGKYLQLAQTMGSQESN